MLHEYRGCSNYIFCLLSLIKVTEKKNERETNPYMESLAIKSSCLKVALTTFLLVSFLSLKESTCETRKNPFYSTSKIFSSLRKSKFRTFDIQI